MNELLNKIYNTVIIYEADFVKEGEAIEEEIKKLLEPYRKEPRGMQSEELQDILYEVSMLSEKKGFQLGVRYAVRLLLKSLVD